MIDGEAEVRKRRHGMAEAVSFLARRAADPVAVSVPVDEDDPAAGAENTLDFGDCVDPGELVIRHRTENAIEFAIVEREVGDFCGDRLDVFGHSVFLVDTVHFRLNIDSMYEPNVLGDGIGVKTSAAAQVGYLVV